MDPMLDTHRTGMAAYTSPFFGAYLPEDDVPIRTDLQISLREDLGRDTNAYPFLGADETDFVGINPPKRCRINAECRTGFARSIPHAHPPIGIDTVDTGHYVQFIGIQCSIEFECFGIDLQFVTSAPIETFTVDQYITSLDIINGFSTAEMHFSGCQCRFWDIDKPSTVDRDTVRVGHNNIGFLACYFQIAMHVGTIGSGNFIENEGCLFGFDIFVSVNVSGRLCFDIFVGIIQNDPICGDIKTSIGIVRDTRSVRAGDVDHLCAVSCCVECRMAGLLMTRIQNDIRSRYRQKD